MEKQNQTNLNGLSIVDAMTILDKPVEQITDEELEATGKLISGIVGMYKRDYLDILMQCLSKDDECLLKEIQPLIACFRKYRLVDYTDMIFLQDKGISIYEIFEEENNLKGEDEFFIRREFFPMKYETFEKYARKYVEDKYKCTTKVHPIGY